MPKHASLSLFLHEMERENTAPTQGLSKAPTNPRGHSTGARDRPLLYEVSEMR